MQTSYPIRVAAKMTGISLDTLRAWERRYKAVVPERSERGRLYSSANIGRLLLLNKLVQRGHAIGSIASLTDDQLTNLDTQQPGPPPSNSPVPRDLVSPILSAIEDFDSLRAANELSRLAAILSPRELVYQVVVPLMREVGVRWHDGTLAIAQEHLVTELLRNLLGSLMHLFRPSSAATKIVLAAPLGESHDLGILAAAMLTSIAGCEPIFLGANLPAGEIAMAAKRVKASVVLLGITVKTGNTIDELSAVDEALPPSCELWVGGAGSPDLDLSNFNRKAVLLGDLPAFEAECRRWSR